jgi:hypothetical protein
MLDFRPLCADSLPYLLTEVISDRLAGHSAQDKPEDLGLRAGVVPSRIGRRDAGVVDGFRLQTF